MHDRITPVILTRDEEDNLPRTLTQLAWAREVVIVDSFSTDATVSIARGFANVRLVQRVFDDLASQWSFAASQATTPWILALDADYILSEAVARELASLAPPPALGAYECSFVYAVNGRPLRASLYPPRPVLLRRDACTFYMDGHTHRVRVVGEVRRLREPIVHDDRKPLRRFLERQRRYMRDEAEKIRTAAPRTLNAAGRIRRLRVVAPFAVAVHTLFVKGLILDGRAGLRYAFERTLAELILSRELMRRRR